jgi:AcrR family transcriptional regulator
MGRKQSYTDNSKIIDCAFELIAVEGFSHFSTRRLASKLGISKTTAYNYIQNKESIIELVVDKAFKLFYQDVFTLIDIRKYKVIHFFDLLLVIAEVLQDSLMQYGDVYKLAYRQMGKSFENGISIEERFVYLYPLYCRIFPDFKYEDFPEFSSQDFLAKHHYLIVLINEMAVIELNRKNKIGKEKHLELIRNAWSLITQCPLPW